MIRILDIAYKDLLQLTRERNTFVFLLIMPIAFTLLFSYAFGGSGGSDSRLPVGYIDQDGSRLSGQLHALLVSSKVIRLEEIPGQSQADLEARVGGQKLAAALVVPSGYGRTSLAGRHPRLTLIADTGTSAGTTAQADILAAANRIDSAVSAALSMEQASNGRVGFDHAFKQVLAAWDKPPIAISETTSSAIPRSDGRTASSANASPGMMLQFAIAGMLTAAQVIVTERKTRSLQRLLTTATRRLHILLGHYLAILTLLVGEFVLLVLFGQLILKVDYARDVPATALVAFSAAVCIAALGLLIGVLAHSEEQAVIFSLIPMFILSGLGGAWVPLEATAPAFQAVGHLSPVAWAMDGFKNIVLRGLGISSVLLPAAALMAYAALFFLIASWRFEAAEER